MSKEKIVTTIKNEELPISKCRSFDKNWYKIGDINIENSGDCYLIKGKYYREEVNNIVFNHSINQYVLSGENILYGIVDIDKDDKIKFGHFNNNKKYSKITLENGSSYLLFKDDFLKDNKTYRELLSNGNYYHINIMSAKKFNEILIPRQDYKTSLPYDSKGITNKFTDLYNNNYNPEIFENVAKYAKVLGNLTFGLEFETTKGILPERIIENYGVIPLRDGSISGIEYVTIPLQGEKGLQYVIDICKILEHRTLYDNSCSLHQHIGNVPRTKEFILAFFKLTCAIQNEIFELFPLFKKYNFRIKNKNYSKPYPIYDLLSQMDNVINSNNIDINFNILYHYLSEGQNFKDVGNDLNNVEFHPRDPNGNQKWLIKNRYYIHNLVPLIFGNKQTVEFRIHTPTYDVNKIIPFILINSILVNYTIDNQQYILEDKTFLCFKNISNIIVEHLNSLNLKDDHLLCDSLLHYIDIRKKGTEKQNSNGIIIGDESKISTSNYLDWNTPKISKKELKGEFYRNSKDFITDPYEEEIKKIEHLYVTRSISTEAYMKHLNQFRKAQKTYRETKGLSKISILEEL